MVIGAQKIATAKTSRRGRGGRLRKTVPIIDLFAGPGGLGEGFSSLRRPDGSALFDIRLSIEKDPFAQKTLELRAFFRKFALGEVPNEYYEYCQGAITREDLFSAYSDQAEAAISEAWCAELGKTPADEVNNRIAAAIGHESDWVLIGGPPCQAYSTAGRARMRYTDPKGFEADERHFLYREYLEIIRNHAPSVFVMENVKGLLSSTVRGRRTFERILDDLSGRSDATAAKYEVRSLVLNGSSSTAGSSDFLLRSEQFGVPQSRHRIILVGLRKDLNLDLQPLSPHSYTPDVRQAIQDLPSIRSGLSRMQDSFEAWKQELSRFRDVNWGRHQQDVALMRRIAKAARFASATQRGDDRYFAGENSLRLPPSGWLATQRYWFEDERLKGGVLNHHARAHMTTDLMRYLFLSSFGEVHGISPRLRDFPESLLPAHRNVNKAMGSDYFADRFRVQLWERPATTVVSHIAKDGHYFVHPAPEQVRSLTVREAARLQTFPDNYFFEGPRTEQYRQVGNAVPPLLAREIARSVWASLSR